MSKAGQKILAGLKDAVDGNFSRVTIEGQTWVKLLPGQVVIDEAKFRPVYSSALANKAGDS